MEEMEEEGVGGEGRVGGSRGLLSVRPKSRALTAMNHSISWYSYSAWKERLKG
jgi:hypothetical protein